MTSGSRRFAEELRQRRCRHPLIARRKLAEAAGMSPQGIEGIEMSKWAAERESVIKTAAALERFGRWTVDAALNVAGYPPLTDAERDELTRPPDPKAQLDAMWAELTPSARLLLVYTATMMIDPRFPLPPLTPPSSADGDGEAQGPVEIGRHTVEDITEDDTGEDDGSAGGVTESTPRTRAG